MLEGVLGPLTDTQDSTVRANLLRLGETLLTAASRIDGRVGWLNAGIELHWMRSGQQSLWSSVEAVDSQHNAVGFIVELRPDWYFGDRSGEVGWTVELSVETDCGHTPDHGAMHQVYSQCVDTVTVEGAIDALADAVRTLELFAGEPLENWSTKGST